MYTFFRYLQLATLYNGDFLLRLVAGVLGNSLNLVYNLVPLKDFSKNHVLAIEPAVQG